jgi:hypothetical protein
VTKAERKALAIERDEVRAKLASIAEVKNAHATPGVWADVRMEDELRARLEELNELLS